MSFLADMGVALRIIQWLRDNGHDAIHFREENLQRLPNGEIFKKALGIKHPPVIYWEVPLDGRRRMLGFIAFIILLITFIPSPFKIL